jgi:FAD/FMN-containing dehydrogenase
MASVAVRRALQRTASSSAPTRDARFGSVTADDVRTLTALLGGGDSGGDSGGRVVRLADDEAASERYARDWLRMYRGAGSLVLRPTTTGQVAEVLRFCNARRLAVVPQGGNTGLVGGSGACRDSDVL